MHQQPRVVPWIDWDEWIYVRNGLFSGNFCEQNCAIEVVTMWRCRGRVPHSVDSTAHLVEISSKDSSCYPENSFHRSGTELQLMYSLAVVRAVNGLVDPGQQGLFADSVHNLASRIGLPAWFVELRHDATHNHLPPLAMLREAAQLLLQWYDMNYWKPQANYLQILTSHSVPILSTTTSNNNNINTKRMKRPCPVPAILLDPSPTLVTHICLPVFIQSAISPLATNRPPLVSVSRQAKANADFFMTQKLLWGDTVKHLTSTPTKWAVIVSLIESVVNVGERVSVGQLSIEDLDWSVSQAESWMKCILESTDGLDDQLQKGYSPSSGTGEGLMTSTCIATLLNQRYGALSVEVKEKLTGFMSLLPWWSERQSIAVQNKEASRVNDEALLLQTASTTTDGFISSTSSRSQKRSLPGCDRELGETRSSNLDGIVKGEERDSQATSNSSSNPWLLGSRPGYLSDSGNKLYLLEQI